MEDESIYENSHAIVFHHLTTTGELVGAVRLRTRDNDDDEYSDEEETEEPVYGNLMEGCDGREEVTDEQDYSTDDFTDDFTDDEEDTEETNQQEIQTQEQENVQQVQEESIQGNSCDEEPDYLLPLALSHKGSVLAGIQRRWAQGLPQLPPLKTNSNQSDHVTEVPWKRPSLKKRDLALDNGNPYSQNNGRTGTPTDVDSTDRRPAMLPLQKTNSWDKTYTETSVDDVLISPANSTPEDRGGNGNTSQGSFLDHTHRQSYLAPQVGNLYEAANQQTQASGGYETSPSCRNDPFIRLENGENICLTPLYRNLLEKPYFHKVVRETAKALVLKGGEGSFLIRPSTKIKNVPLCITVCHGDSGHVHHIRIREREDNLFALGNPKFREKTFATIDDIVNTHRRTPIKLENGEAPKLIYPVPKAGNA